MSHYTGIALPEKCFHEQWMDTMADNVRQSIRHYMDDCGHSYESAKAITKRSSTAGSKIWEIIDKEFSGLLT